jgi:3-hydroxyacyl-[acyl-carrier-protein] dehydratase
MSETVLKNLDVMQIQQYQQNRYPVLFIDYVDEAMPGKYAKGYKNFSFNEWFFPAHFADEPNVPGFIQVEMLTQMFLMTFLTMPGNVGKKTSFVNISNAQFKKKIVPGDRVDIESSLSFYSRGVAKGKSVGTVNGEFACSIELTVAIPDVLNQFKPAQK